MQRAAVSILLTSAAAVAAPAHVAVVPSAAVNIAPTRVDALTQDLAEALDAELDVDAAGGLEVRRRLPIDLPPECVTEPACIQKVAQATGASQLLFVVMVDLGGDAVSVDVTWADASGKTMQRPPISLTNTSDADAKAKFQLSARRMLPDVPVRPTQENTVTVDRIAGRVVAGKPRHVTIPAMITAGTTLAGLGMGIGFGLAARSKYNECKRESEVAGSLGCGPSLRSTVTHFDIGADVGWGLAVASAVATVVLYATSGESPHLIAAPAEGGGAVLSAVGTF